MSDRRLSGRLTRIIASGFLILLSGCGQDAAPSHRPDADPMKIEHGGEVTLDDGSSVRFSTRANREVHVQFKKKGEGWTDPERLYKESSLWTHGMEIQEQADTVVIDVGFWTEKELDDDYRQSTTVQVVCRDQKCSDPLEVSGWTSSDLADDGHVVWMPVDEDTASRWTPDGGSEEFDLPSGKTSHVDVGRDGDLQIASAREESEDCVYELSLIGTKASDDLQVAATARFPSSGAPCLLEDSEFADDTIKVSRGGPGIEEQDDSTLIVFTREDGGWNAQAPTSKLINYPDTQGESTIASRTIKLANGDSISIGSPDQKRIMGSLVGSSADPQVIARAPKGTVCRLLAEPETRDEVKAPAPRGVVLVQCSASAPGGKQDPYGQPARGLVIATNDGKHWMVQQLRDPATTLPFTLGNRAYFPDSAGVWTWSEGAKKISRLSLPPGQTGASIMMMPDGKHLARVTANQDPDAPCRPTWSMALPDDSAWGPETPLPKTALTIKGNQRCSLYKMWVINEGGRDILRLYIRGEKIGQEWTGAIVGKGSSWRDYESDDIPDN